MTDEIYFDADCLQSFLWVDKEGIIIQLYRGKVCVPEQVIAEINKVPQLKSKFEQRIRNRSFLSVSMDIDSTEVDFYRKLTNEPPSGFKLIGRGEASAITLAKFREGILGSNNLKDILPFVRHYHLRLLTTGNILVEALDRKLVSEGQVEVIWQDMQRWQKLPTQTFAQYLKEYGKSKYWPVP